MNALDKTVERVSALISDKRPDLQVISVDEFAEMMMADFQRFKATSMFYGPVIILISIQIVIATALAMAFSRRRELAVLRTTGIGAAQVRLLFIIESTLVSVLGAVAGYLFSLLAAQAIFKGRSVNLLPGVAAAVSSRHLVRRDVADVLSVTPWFFQKYCRGCFFVRRVHSRS